MHMAINRWQTALNPFTHTLFSTTKSDGSEFCLKPKNCSTAITKMKVPFRRNRSNTIFKIVATLEIEQVRILLSTTYMLCWLKQLRCLVKMTGRTDKQTTDDLPSYEFLWSTTRRASKHVCLTFSFAVIDNIYRQYLIWYQSLYLLHCKKEYNTLWCTINVKP